MPSRSLTVALVAVWFAVAGSAVAQQVAEAEYFNTGVAALKDDPSYELRLFEMGAQVGAPLYLRAPDTLLVAAQYTAFLRKLYTASKLDVGDETVEADPLIESNALEDELHAATLGLLYFHRFSERWRLAARATGGFAGDFQVYDPDGLILAASLGASFRPVPSFELDFGLVWVDGLRPMMAVPLVPYVGCRWMPADWFALRLAPPRMASATFRFLDRLEVYLLSRFRGYEFVVEEHDLGIRRHDLVQVHAGGGVGLAVWRELWLSVEAGAVPFLRFEGVDSAGDRILGGDHDLTWYAAAYLDLREFPFRKKDGQRPEHGR